MKPKDIAFGVAVLLAIVLNASGDRVSGSIFLAVALLLLAGEEPRA